MTKNLRKWHLQFWIILLIALPAGIIFTRLATPATATDKLLQPVTVAALSTIIKTITKEDYTINIRKSNDTTFQLEWINKRVLTVPTATIYKVANGKQNIKIAELIGRIEARGTYRFPLNVRQFSLSANQPINFQLMVYDFIHQQIIDTINFRQ